MSGSTAPGTLTLQAVTGSLPVGTYTATVPLLSGAASNSPQSLTVTFTITRPSTLSGSAAAGESIVGTVTIKDSSRPSKEKFVTIAADGRYAIDISGLTVPFMLRADGAVRGRSYSIYSAAVQADVGGTINVTPLTDLIVANVAGQIAAAIYQSGDFSGLTSASLNAAEGALQARLQPVLAAVGVNTIDLLRTPFSANGTGLDAALGVLQVTVDAAAGRATITNTINNQQIIDDLTIQSDATALTDTGGVAAGLITSQSGCDVLAFQPPELKPICPDSLPSTSTTFEIGLDGRSRIATLTNALTGNVSSYGYGSTNQLATVITRDSAATLLATTNFEIGIDGKGRVAQQINARTGNLTSLGYGSTNQLATVVTHDSAGILLVTTTLEIGLTGKGRVAQQTNARTRNITSFSYGSTNQLATVVTRDSAGTLLVTATFEIGLDGLARVHIVNDHQTGRLSTNNYDSSNQLATAVTHDSAGTLLTTISFEVGPAGPRVHTVNDHETGRLSTYVYDANNRATVISI